MGRVVVLLLAVRAVLLSGIAGHPAAAFAADGDGVALCSEQGAVRVVLGPDGAPADPGGQIRHCLECLPLPALPALPAALLPVPAAAARTVRLPAPALPVVARLKTPPPVRSLPLVI